MEGALSLGGRQRPANVKFGRSKGSIFLSIEPRDLTVQRMPEGADEAEEFSASSAAAATHDAIPAESEQSSAMLANVLASLDDDKAEDIVSIDLQGKTPMADHLVVASGRSQRHVSAMADHLVRKLKEAGFGRADVEGLNQADWVLIDAGDVIIHLFRPEVREFYKLEKMWAADIPPEALHH